MKSRKRLIGGALTIATFLPLAVPAVGMAQNTASTAAVSNSSDILEEVTPQSRPGLFGKAKEGVKNLFSSIEVKGDLTLADLEIMEGLKAKLGGHYAVEPSFQSTDFTRIDGYRLRTPIKVGEMLLGKTRPLFLDIDADATVYHIRQFPTESQAYSAAPSPSIVTKLPLTAENADALQPGEVVMLPLTIDIMSGVGTLPNTGVLQPFGQAYYLMSGKFQVQVLKQKNNRVRVRLVAHRKNGNKKEVGVNLGFDGISLKLLRKTAQGIVGKSLGEISFTKEQGTLFMADYIFDLSKQEVRDAYNALLSPSRVFKAGVSLLNPNRGSDNLQEKFISDLSGIEALAKADANKKLEDRRVIQVFKGKNEYATTGDARDNSSFQIGPRPFFIRGEKSQTMNEVTFYDSYNNETIYAAPVKREIEKSSLLWNWYHREEVMRTATVIVPLDGKKQPTGQGDYVLSLELKDKTLKAGEQGELLKTLRRSMPKEVVQHLAIEPQLSAKQLKNARVYFQVIFNQEAFHGLRNITRQQLATKLAEYMEQNFENLPSSVAHNILARSQGKPMDRAYMGVWLGLNEESIQEMLVGMEKVWGGNIDIRERLERFMELQSNRAFRVVGTGFMASLLPQNRLSDILKVSTRVDAREFSKSIEGSFGQSDTSEIYKVVEYIQNLINDGSFDMRLETFGQKDTIDGQVINFTDVKKNARK